MALHWHEILIPFLWDGVILGWWTLACELIWAYEEENWQKENFGLPACVCFLAKHAPCVWSSWPETSLFELLDTIAWKSQSTLFQVKHQSCLTGYHLLWVNPSRAGKLRNPSRWLLGNHLCQCGSSLWSGCNTLHCYCRQVELSPAAWIGRGTAGMLADNCKYNYVHLTIGLYCAKNGKIFLFN
jgi:hypothetical protein